MVPKPIICKRIRAAVLAAVMVAMPVAAFAKHGNKPNSASSERATDAAPVLWQQPGDIASRDLYYGSGRQRTCPSYRVHI